jgi:DnaK suppressor protein
MTHGLSERQVHDIAHQLQVERTALLDQMRQQIQETQEAGERSDRYSQLKDPADYSVADLMGDMRLDQLDRETEHLREIEDAEARIAKGTYGECMECGGDIRPERLLAQPTASRCVDCQEKYEREHASHITNKF